VVDDLAGSEFGIAGDGIGVVLAVEELVAEEAAVGVEDGLASEKAVGGAGVWGGIG
jgi:hypothetical protein